MTVLPIWTIYKMPGAPTMFVARRFDVTSGRVDQTLHMVSATNLPDLRDQMVRRGLALIPRSPADDAAIIESWL